MTALNRFSRSRRATTCLLALSASAGMAATNQFRGVNWADERDNFQSGVLYLSGLSSTDTYASASTVADRVVGEFMSKLGSNAVRMPINEATVCRVRLPAGGNRAEEVRKLGLPPGIARARHAPAGSSENLPILVPTGF